VDALRQVQGKVDAFFVDTGEQDLKNIARRVRVYRVELNHGNITQGIAPNLGRPRVSMLRRLGRVYQQNFIDT
jgi:hypothetical protein